MSHNQRSSGAGTSERRFLLPAGPGVDTMRFLVPAFALLVALMPGAVRGQAQASKQVPDFHFERGAPKRLVARETATYYAPMVNAKRWRISTIRPLTTFAQVNPVARLYVPSHPQAEIKIAEGPTSFLWTNVPVSDEEGRTRISAVAEYAATVYPMVRVPGPPTKPVAPLSDAERSRLLAPSKWLDFRTPAFEQFVKENKLQRGTDEQGRYSESDFDYAWRAYAFVAKTFTYGVQKVSPPASQVCQPPLTDDCVGLAYVYVSLLRLHGVPADLMSGNGIRAANEDGPGDASIHAKAVVFCDALGWFWVDPSAGAKFKATVPIERYFGTDTGNFLSLQGGVGVEVNLPGSPPQTLAFALGVRFGMSGSGNWEGLVSTRKWECNRVPLAETPR